MNKFFSLAVLTLCITGILLVNCSSKKNSEEACLFQTTMDLDRGNYDAVLASPCASNMQIGAAWFGKANFDIKDVINRFSETGSNSTASDLNSFMTSLVGKVDASSFTAFDNAKNAYTLVTSSTPSTSDENKDALFYISLVDAVKGLSIIKIAIQNPAGLLDTTCNLNSSLGNTVADQVDATACALKYSFNSAETCASIPASFTTSPTFTIYKLVNGATSTIPYSNVFTAMTITTGAGANSTCGLYTKLLYNDPLSPTGRSVATVTEERCTGSINSTAADLMWPCPIENSQYLNLVTSLDASLDAAITSMSSSLTSSLTGTTTDVQQSINDIKSQNCCVDEGPSAWNPDIPSSCTCSSSEIAAYLQTI